MLVWSELITSHAIRVQTPPRHIPGVVEVSSLCLIFNDGFEFVVHRPPVTLLLPKNFKALDRYDMVIIGSYLKKQGSSGTLTTTVDILKYTYLSQF